VEKKHRDYLKSEFGVEDVDSLNDEDFDSLYEKLCDIEVYEVCAASNESREVSDFGEMVSDIVTYMGNQYEKYSLRGRVD
jgi:hypothetical protein